jgi:methylmalonyl-CoA mutase
MKDQNEKLFSEFPPVSVSEWEEQIKADLKGADYEKKLFRKSPDNLKVKPYYTAEDLGNLEYLEQAPGKFPYVRGNRTAGNTWEIRQDFRIFDISTTVQKAVMAVERGATSIGFDLTAKGDLYYHDFKKLITGIDITKTRLNLLAGESAHTVMEYLLKVLAEDKINPAQVAGSIDFDPLGYLARSGGFYRSESDDFADAESLLVSARQKIPGFRVLAANSHIFSDCGANAVQELAFGLAMLSEYMVRLTDKNHKPADIIRHLQWNIGTGSDYFMEMAKVRAARLLFSTMVSGFGSDEVKDTPIFIHSITTNWNKTLYDPNVNMLRLTTEAMAAILGGCDSLQVKPYDCWYKESDDFSERLARNIQVILKEESYFDKVVDPAAGSYYIESLTDSLIQNAWELFLKIDDQGGFVKAFISGFIQDEVSKTASRRSEMVATRREVLVGTNQFPSFHEQILSGIDPEIAFRKTGTNINKVAEPIKDGWAAQDFEKLRLATERAKSRPKVFMLTYGNLAMRLARSQFSSNFFACAGYEIIDNLGFKTAQEGVEKAFKEKADIVVVCSSDDEYAQIAPEVNQLVNGKAIVVVAGAPACMDDLKQKGIMEFIHIRSNVLETLKNFHAKLGIA